MRVMLACTFIALCVPSTAAAQEATCAHDRDALLTLDERTFDRAEGGWRTLAETPACRGAAADLLATYRAAHPEIADQSGLLHHEAQMRAAAGETEAAITLIEQTRAFETEPATLAYRDAELAFLRGDRPALIAARERLAAIPTPESFADAVARFRERYPDLEPPRWPINLDVVDGLIACFGRPYDEAYACRG